MPNPAGPSPTAEGSLGKTPLTHLLVYMADRMLSGSLQFVSDQPDGTTIDHVAYFQLGAPAKVRTGEPMAYLGRVLFELGLVDEATLDRSLVEVAKTKGLHGEQLVGMGAIDHEGLLTGLRAQAVRKLGYLFQLPPVTRYAFYADVNLLDGWGGPELVPLDPLPLIWNAVCTQIDEHAVRATLGRLGAATLRMHPDSDASRFGFDAGQLAVVDLIRASPRSLASLIEADVAQQLTTRLVVYALLVTRHLDHGVSAAPPVGLQHAPVSTRMRAAKPAGVVAVARVRLKPMRIEARTLREGTAPGARDALQPAEAVSAAEPLAASARAPDSEELEARRRAIVDRAETIDREDYFTMLGVARDSPESVLQSSYFMLAKLWHPDRLAPELSDVKTAANKVFARMSEAFETLSDPARRKQYAQVLQGGAGTPEEAETIQKIVDAASDFQRADIYYKTHDLASALRMVRRAHEADPEQADYAALYATILAEQRTLPGASYQDLLEMLDRAIDKNERSERAFIARASIRKRSGQAEAAIDDYRRVLVLNPKNTDAAREVRLYDMRRSKRPEGHSGPAPSAKGSIISRLFKR
jgi:curved DNA-binding protein CbpA